METPRYGKHSTTNSQLIFPAHQSMCEVGFKCSLFIIDVEFFEEFGDIVQPLSSGSVRSLFEEPKIQLPYLFSTRRKEKT